MFNVNPGTCLATEVETFLTEFTEADSFAETGGISDEDRPVFEAAVAAAAGLATEVASASDQVRVMVSGSTNEVSVHVAKA